ncbi:beta-carotene 15,15'-dioxygenase, Brp/Blh family [Methylobacterium sp. NI91]|nr:beta-carotene 15,15'-dioxygenase, Brp/Blh family [Methylobacterium sp. CLZ]QIJ81052.1 beta-carotene 15,15'-dioxygenase, Brp/Blh family [Methylobacterium sp. NI91]
MAAWLFGSPSVAPVRASRHSLRATGAHTWRLAGAAVALSLVASAALPREASWAVALAFVIVLGVPHGALDGAVAAPMLRPRYGRIWFGVFALPYLGASALVLLAWQVAPLATLAGFLALSVLHFGEEDAGPGQPVEALVRGGLPIALPALLQPEETARIFAVVTLIPLGELPAWWVIGAWIWAAVVVIWLMTQRPRRALLIELTLLYIAFWLLPPLTAFALYFVGLHAPRHMLALVHDTTRAPKVDTLGKAVLTSLPVFALTLLLGALLWPLYAAGSRSTPSTLLTLTLQMLSALTVPHVILDRIAGAHSRT